jgi:hypothetical protein
MRLIEFPRGKLVEVCYQCERERGDADDMAEIDELIKRFNRYLDHS